MSILDPYGKVYCWAAVYLIVLFFINMNSHSQSAKLNIADDSLGYFAAGGLGEFAAYFAIGCIIFLIFNKFNKQSEIETESEET